MRIGAKLIYCLRDLNKRFSNRYSPPFAHFPGCGQDRRQSPDFFLHRYRHCRAVRAGRFRADIQNVGTFSNHSTGVVEGAGWIDEPSAIGE